MESIKKILRPIYVPFLTSNFYRKKVLIFNFVWDYILYTKYSLTFNSKGFKNKESDLILNYHSLEKGMLFDNMKHSFAAYRIRNLHVLLNDPEIVSNVQLSQVKVGYQVMCKYYELHQEKNYDIEDIFSRTEYLKYKQILDSSYNRDFTGVLQWSKEEFYKDCNSNFLLFANSRKSTRKFNGKLISHEVLNKVITLSNSAPSVCNRQASNVYLVEDKAKIDKLLEIQGGFTGYAEDVRQLLVVTNDRRYYYTIGERNQFYIDGGIYLMNLLYALHFYQIGNCPANWGKTYSDESKLKKVITLPESEKIICMIPIGMVEDQFYTTLSKRRANSENFKIL